MRERPETQIQTHLICFTMPLKPNSVQKTKERKEAHIKWK